MNDTDQDGICDEFEIEGCLDEASCNYDANATDNNCTYAEAGYDCDGQCISDADGDGVCDSFETAGCTAANACNYDDAASDDDGTCVFCGCENESNEGDSSSPYTLTVEEYTVDLIPGQTTYRIYQNMVNADDFMSSVFGNNDNPFSFATTNGFYNSPFGGTTAGDINSLLFTFFPDLAADSWVTVGIEAVPNGSEVAISVVESSDQPWINAFAAGSSIDGQDIVMNDFTGGAWYALNGTPNGLPDENNRVLIMQITTAGDVSGVFNTQVFGNGNGEDDIRNTYTFTGTGTFSADGSGNTGSTNACGCTDAEAVNYDNQAQYDDGSCIDTVNGCTDAEACNYNEDANTEDDSCFYAEAGYNCDGNCLVDTDQDGVCDEFEVAGCQNSAACNYNEDATDEDGSCLYAEEGYDCNGNCLVDSDGDGVCDSFEVAGCQDSEACNYNEDATDDDASCTYPEAGYDCDGACVNDTDEDGICDESEVAGCTDAEAANYDPFATDDDATCLEPICIDPEACNYTEFSGNDYCLIVQPYQVHDGMVGDQDLTGYVTYRIYVKTQNNDDFVSSVSGDNEFPTRIMSSGNFFQSPFGGLLGSDQNPALIAFFPAAEYDSYVTIGLTEGAGAGEGVINTIEDTGNPWGFNFETGQDLLIDDAIGGGWFIFNGQTNGVAGDDSQVLLAQVTTNGALSGSLYVQTFINGSPANEVRTLLDIEEACVAPGGPEVCEFSQAGYDCNGECTSDADGDGVCDEFEVAGCTDQTACNYSAEATDDDGNCLFTDEGYDCNGECLNDADQDGVCDEFEIEGCSDETACNYNAQATDDAECTYATAGYECDGQCNTDTDGDGICDEFEVVGCINPEACNYDANATDDDAGCEYAEAGYDCDGICITDIDEDGICDTEEITGCTIEYACNYNPEATDQDDESCFYATAVFDCEGNCQMDENGNGLCDQLEDDFINLCGEGTIWDPASGQCIALLDDCPYDLNGDGMVQLQDLMDFLLYYGTYCPE